jgi:hypothetical protein
MLKYEGRHVEVLPGGIIVRVIKEGTPLDGKHYFRNKKAQAIFDELRNQRYIDDYWHVGDKFFFRFLSGEECCYTRREILRAANEE